MDRFGDATRHAAERRLAVYGSLAPGRENHHQLADLKGEWRSGLFVTGDLIRHAGYTALRWTPDGPRVPVHLFVSEDLPKHWARLDEFEGPDYERIVVPLLDENGIVTVANVYAAHARLG